MRNVTCFLAPTRPRARPRHSQNGNLSVVGLVEMCTSASSSPSVEGHGQTPHVGSLCSNITHYIHTYESMVDWIITHSNIQYYRGIIKLCKRKLANVNHPLTPLYFRRKINLPSKLKLMEIYCTNTTYPLRYTDIIVSSSSVGTFRICFRVWLYCELHRVTPTVQIMFSYTRCTLVSYSSPALTIQCQYIILLDAFHCSRMPRD